jgi:transcription-repair coupling factor (superfamily II helicase)
VTAPAAPAATGTATAGTATDGGSRPGAGAGRDPDTGPDAGLDAGLDGAIAYRRLPGLIARDPAQQALLGRRSATVSIPEASRAYMLAGLVETGGRRPTLVAVPTAADAERLCHDLAAFLGGERVALFPAWETLPFERVSPAIETMGRRIEVMWRLRQADRAPDVVVAPIRSLLQRLGPHVDEIEPVVVKPGDVIDPGGLVRGLVGAGYRREFQVEHRGEVAQRGSIVDVFPSTADHPVRIDLWGDDVDRLTEFSVADQRSTAELTGVEIFPAREMLATADVRSRAAVLVAAEPWGREQWDRLADGELFDGMESWLPWLTGDERVLPDLLGPDARIVLVEPRRLRDRSLDLTAEEGDLAATLATTWGTIGRDVPRLHVPFDRLLAGTDAPAWTVTSAPEGPDSAAVEASGWEPVVGAGDAIIDQLRQLRADGYRVVVAADGAGSAARLSETLGAAGVQLEVRSPGDDEVVARSGGHIVPIPLEHGFVLPSVKLAVLTEADLTGRRRTHRQARPRRRSAISSFEDLTPGDYVVHHHHGVARYGGMEHRAMMGTERDYLVLQYRGSDRLYLPSDQIDVIRPYTGGETPTLNRMGGADFARAKSRVRTEVRRVAQELVVLYQRRVTASGHAYDPDTPWQHELEAAFPYQETPDQLHAIADVKQDMEDGAPMDRLVCGDVGFGKTEVAIRAVFKAVQSGKQAAVLVPTTLLAQQHHQTFSERFAGFPVRVEVLSRFLTPAQQRRVLADLSSGAVDVVIGTHRLLSGDVLFKDLGLLVVDEEQRFGVQHKEAVKRLRTEVDVLTLTATPIPRTLEMSLTGIRDLSLLNTPPADRQPILTYVGEYDQRAVAEAIRRELLREGQVFYVHNRVADIEETAAGLRDLVPEARVVVAHGQMDEGTLERVVIDFWEGRADVLVCTTIIESGIDMPTVNTLVVERADLLGLGQLHQIRGRVGRSGQRAYAYLFHPVDRVLSEEAYERLKTIGESTELGSGFRIAMRDLEIRGAGNLLGEAQAGHIAAVGYDLYCQMVTEAVAELKGEPVSEPVEVTLDLPVKAFLPDDYVQKAEARLEAYRRLGAVIDHATVDDIAAEWLDRYGPVPDPAGELLAVGHLRAECVRLGIREVGVLRSGAVRLAPLTLRTSEQVRLQRLAPGSVHKPEGNEVQATVPSGVDLPSHLTDLLAQLRPAEQEAVAG